MKGRKIVLKKNICMLILLLFAACFAPLAARANSDPNLINLSDSSNNPTPPPGAGWRYDPTHRVYTIGSSATVVTVTGSNEGNGRRIVVNSSSNSTTAITLKDVTIENPYTSGPAMLLQDNGTVTITLVGENNITSDSGNAGIQTGPGTLTINGTGSLTATGGTGGAGIGGAGIGGSQSGMYASMTINSGTVTAKGGSNAAGIGSGQGSGYMNGTLTITGGNVTAIAGGDTSLAIGGSNYSGNVTVKGTYDYWTNKDNNSPPDGDPTPGVFVPEDITTFKPSSNNELRYIRLEGKSTIEPPNSVVANGVEATGAVTPPCNQKSGTAMTVTVTLAGTAAMAGTHTVGLTSATLGAGGITPPIVTRSVAAGDDLTDNNTFVFTFTMPPSAVEDLAVTHTFAVTPPPDTKMVSVGTQSGTLTAGVEGTVTFSITTANINNAIYTANVSSLPAGVTAGQVTISGNAGTLTLTGNDTTTAGVTNNLKLTIDDTESSNVFTLTIGDDPQTPDDGGGCNAAGLITVFALPAVIQLLRKKLT